MGKRGDGYGSEDHFIRLRVENGEDLDHELLSALNAPGGQLHWTYPTGAAREREPEGLDFLQDRADVQALWADFWPQRGRAQCWDGVALLTGHGPDEWVLMEAKANATEIVTPGCGASDRGGRAQISAGLEAVKRILGVAPEVSWLDSYYQYANRLAALHFLNNIAKVPARLLNIYFTGGLLPRQSALPRQRR